MSVSWRRYSDELRAGFALLREALRIFSGRGARFLGAAVAFYALVSAAPLFVVILHAVSAIFGRARAESALWGGLAAWLAPEGLETARELTERLERLEASGSVVGAILVLYGSTRLFRALRRAMNILWDTDLERIERARGRLARYGLRYGGALALTLFTAGLVCALLIVKIAFALIATIGVRAPPAMLWGLDLVVSVALAFALFVTLFRFLPEARVTLREAASSAIVTTILFAVGSSLVTVYVRHKHVSDLYEGAGAVVVAVVWVYYSTQVFFLGACVGAALHRRSGARPASALPGS